MGAGRRGFGLGVVGLLLAGLLTVESEAAANAVAGGPYTLTVGGSVVLNGASSTAASPTASVAQYLWDIDGNGTFGELSGAEPVLSWSQIPLAAGSYTIRLLVRDSSGDVGFGSASLAVVATHLAVHDRFGNGGFSAADQSAAPVFGPDGRLYGTSRLGGEVRTAAGVSRNAGSLWRMNADGTGFAILRNLYSPLDGERPVSSPVFGSDGKLYGTTSGGGTNGAGTLWRMNVDGTGFTVLRHLDAAADGRGSGGLVFGNDGRLYGTTSSGGLNSSGTFWRMNADGTSFTVLRHLVPASDGSSPFGAPVFGSDGNLYGTTQEGGANNGGTVWRINPSGAGFMVLRALTRTTDGSGPSASIVFGSDGRIYGATMLGGTTDGGTLWRMNVDGSSFTVLRHLTRATDGAVVLQSPNFGPDGRLYGTASQGGTNFVGTFWRMNADGSGFSVLRQLTGIGSDGGGLPKAALIFGVDGRLYGTTTGGFAPDLGGTVLRMNLDGSGFVVLRRMNAASVGRNPVSAPIFGNAGKLYGTTAAGGAYDSGGTLWRFNPDGTDFTVLRDFSVADGGVLVSSPVLGSDGRLYGNSSQYGTFNGGTIWRINQDGTGFSVLRHLSPVADGEDPRGAPVFGSDGRLYGTSNAGGSAGRGTLWRINADGSAFAVLRHFQVADGGYPAAGPVFGGDGRLYGTLEVGGNNNEGTVWRSNSDGSGFSVLYHLSASEGSFPRGSVVFGTDGKLYGTSSQGGANGRGTLWRMNTDGTDFTVLRHLASVDGGAPLAGMVFGPDGKLHGTTSSGGTFGSGTLWRMNADGTNFLVLWHMRTFPEGGIPRGAPVLGADGKIYGTAVPTNFGNLSVGNGTIYAWSNRAPTAAFTSTPVPANAGQTVNFDASASTDPDGDGLVYDWSFGDGSPPVVLTTSATTHVYAVGGNYTATLQVTDSFGVASALVTRTITVNGLNQPPVAHSQSLGTAEDMALAVTLTGSDPDSNPLTYAVVSSPAHGTLAGVAPALTYTPAANYFGPDSFTFKVNDGTTDSALATVSLNVTPVNDAPALASPGNHTVDELALLSFTLAAADVDTADTLSYSISAGNLAGMNLVASTGAFSWTPTEQQGPGIYSVTFRVTDNGSPTRFDEKTVSITVNETNTAPVLANPGNRSVLEQTLLSFTLGATDADAPANAITYSIQAGQVGGMVLDAGTGVFTWTPNVFQGPANHVVTFRATDSGGLFDEKTIIITVTEPVPVNITSQTQFVASGFRLDRATGRYGQTITLKNVGGQPIAGPISLIFDQLPANVTQVVPMSSITNTQSPLGSPFIMVTLGGNGEWAPGASMAFGVSFANPSNQPITYTIRVLAGPGTP